MPFLPVRAVTLLHVSDLHLGRDEVSEDGELTSPLWRQLGAQGASKPILGEQFDLCLLTGDLARSSPDRGLYDRLGRALERQFPQRNGERVARRRAPCRRPGPRGQWGVPVVGIRDRRGHDRGRGPATRRGRCEEPKPGTTWPGGDGSA